MAGSQQQTYVGGVRATRSLSEKVPRVLFYFLTAIYLCLLLLLNTPTKLTIQIIALSWPNLDMSKLANFENKNDTNSVRIQTLISTLINVIVNIIQNINLMNHMDKIGSSDNSICFSLLHLNIRSLNRNYDNLINCLASIKNKFSVIGISVNVAGSR